MSKTYCPAKCGKLFVTEEFAIAHANEHHPNWDKPQEIKSKGWRTPYGFFDFTEPCTYEEALQKAGEIINKINLNKEATND